MLLLCSGRKSAAPPPKFLQQFASNPNGFRLQPASGRCAEPLVNIGSAGVFTAYPVPTFLDNISHRNEAIKSVIGVILMVLSSREAAYSVAAPVAVDKGVVAPACGVIPPESAGCLVPVGGAPAPAPRRGVLLRIGGVAPAVDAAVVVVVDQTIDSAVGTSLARVSVVSCCPLAEVVVVRLLQASRFAKMLYPYLLHWLVGTLQLRNSVLLQDWV